MKRVLIVIHLPRASPRIEGLVRYLPEFGWEPIILTGVTDRYRDLPARIVETPYRNALGFLGRLLGAEPEKDAREEVEVGELGYWPKGPAFCIFFGPTPVSKGPKPKAYSPVNVFGKVLDNWALLKDIRNGTLVTVTKE